MKKWKTSLLVVAVILLVAKSTYSLQPLENFLHAARTNNPNNLESLAKTDAAQAEAAESIGRLLPSVSFNGSYSRNQYETSMSLSDASGTPQKMIITPIDQLDGTITFMIPLVDLTGFWRARAAKAQARSSQWRQAATISQIESNVIENYCQVIADVGLVVASEQALEVAKASLSLSKTLFQSGMVPALDVDRAEAEVERHVQQLAVSRFQLELDRRSLVSLTGMKPDLTNMPTVSDDLHEEPPLETFQSSDYSLPSLAAAIEARRAQHKQDVAQRLTTLPSLSGSFTEHGTNAEGFGGHEWYWQAMLTLTWNFNVSTYATIRAQGAQLRAAKAREDIERLSAQDAIHRSWHSVQTAIARCRSARKQAQVSRHAAELARDRYSVGATIQLETLQAERDAFLAEINHIQTEADLINARAQLLLAAGRTLKLNNEVMP